MLKGPGCPRGNMHIGSAALNASYVSQPAIRCRAVYRASAWDTIGSVKVIGAGLPRTATLTQKIALEMLGFGPCYHMVNVLADLTLADGWADALAGQADW